MRLTKAMDALMDRENDAVMKYVQALILRHHAVNMGVSPALVARFTAISDRYKQEDDALIAELEILADKERERQGDGATEGVR